MSETYEQALARLDEWSHDFHRDVELQWESAAERRRDDAAERFWEGSDRFDRCRHENQQDLALHDYLFPSGRYAA